MVERQHAELIAKLTSATGISVMEATALVELVGPNWPSLMREARMIRRSDSTPVSPGKRRP